MFISIFKHSKTWMVHLRVKSERHHWQVKRKDILPTSRPTIPFERDWYWRPVIVWLYNIDVMVWVMMVSNQRWVRLMWVIIKDTKKDCVSIDPVLVVYIHTCIVMHTNYHHSQKDLPWQDQRTWHQYPLLPCHNSWVSFVVLPLVRQWMIRQFPRVWRLYP